nr:OmpA family protein [Bradyrhizobium sp.]
MTKLRLALLATTALTAMQLAGSPSHAQSAPIVVAQQREEPGSEGKPKQPPKEAPRGTPPARPGAPPTPHQPPQPQHAPVPPQHQAPPPPQHPAAPPPQRPSAPPPQHPPAPPPAAAPHAPPPAAAPHVSPPAAVPAPAAPKPPAAPSVQPHEREREMERQQKMAPPQQHPPTPPAAPQQTPHATQPPAPPTATPQQAPHTAQPPAPPAATPQQAPHTAQPPAPPAAAPQQAPHTAQPPAPPAATPQQAPGAAPGGQTSLPPAAATMAHRPPPQVTAPLPPPPAPQNLTPLPANPAAAQGPRRIEDFRNQRREVQEGGRTVITEPGRLIVRDPSGEAFVRHDEMERFRYGARNIETQRVGGEMRTIVVRPDGSEIITVLAPDGSLLRRIRRGPRGEEFVLIDNSYRDPRAVGGFYVALPPPVIRIPYDRYIVDAADAPPDLIYETMEAPPVERIERRYTLDEIRYSPNVRMLMPSIDVNSINFDLGSWEIAPDQAAKLQVIADGLNRAIQRNPREVFLIEGHTDATGNDTDNLSLSDRRAESAAELLTQQFGVPAENLTSQGYGSQYLKEQTSGPSRINRRVTVRRITPLLNGGTASLPPPPPGTVPPR